MPFPPRTIIPLWSNSSGSRGIDWPEFVRLVQEAQTPPGGMPIYQATFTPGNPNLITIAETPPETLASGYIGVRLPGAVAANLNATNFVTGAGDRGPIRYFITSSDPDGTQITGGDLWLLAYMVRTGSPGWFVMSLPPAIL